MPLIEHVIRHYVRHDFDASNATGVCRANRVVVSSDLHVLTPSQGRSTLTPADQNAARLPPHRQHRTFCYGLPTFARDGGRLVAWFSHQGALTLACTNVTAVHLAQAGCANAIGDGLNVPSGCLDCPTRSTAAGRDRFR